MPQVPGQLSSLDSLDQKLVYLLEQTVLADQVFRFLEVQQFFKDFVFICGVNVLTNYGAHAPGIVRLNIILHALRPSLWTRSKCPRSQYWIGANNA
jgi:hypothetical protein